MSVFTDYAAKMRQMKTPFNGGLQSYLDGQNKLRQASPLYNTDRMMAITPTAPAPVEQPQQPQVDTENAINSIAEMLGPTPAEREARERRALERRAKMSAWAGLFDGLRQFGNLYSVYKGATPQQLSSPYQAIDNEINQQRAIADANDNYRRQYAQSLYNLRRQMNQDQMQHETHQAQLDWYKNRDEQNARKVDIQQFKAEADAAYKEATLEQKEKILEIRRQVADNLISYRQGQLEIARIRANKSNGSGGGGRNNGTYGYKTTTYYDDQGRKVTERVPTTGGVPERRVQEPKKPAAQQGKGTSGKSKDKYKNTRALGL